MYGWNHESLFISCLYLEATSQIFYCAYVALTIQEAQYYIVTCRLYGSTLFSNIIS